MQKQRITVARGDGIGPETMQATLDIIQAAGAPLEYDEIEIGEKVYERGVVSGIPAEAWEIVQRNRRCSILVEPTPGTSALQGVLLEGIAELIEVDREHVARISERIYARYLTPEELRGAQPQSWLVDPENTIVCLRPEKTMAF